MSPAEHAVLSAARAAAVPLPTMTQLYDDLMQWRRQGFTVELEGDERLRYRAPDGYDATVLQAWLRAHKAALILLLHNLGAEHDDDEPHDDGSSVDTTGQTSSLADYTSAQLLDHAQGLLRHAPNVNLPYATLVMAAAQVVATQELTRETYELTDAVRRVAGEIEDAALKWRQA